MQYCPWIPFWALLRLKPSGFSSSSFPNSCRSAIRFFHWRRVLSITLCHSICVNHGIPACSRYLLLASVWCVYAACRLSPCSWILFNNRAAWQQDGSHYCWAPHAARIPMSRNRQFFVRSTVWAARLWSRVCSECVVRAFGLSPKNKRLHAFQLLSWGLSRHTTYGIIVLSRADRSGLTTLLIGPRYRLLDDTQWCHHGI